MKSKAKTMTILNYTLSSVLWLLGILTLVFNILGLWGAWHLAAYGFYLYHPVAVCLQVLALVFSHNEKNKNLMVANYVALAISSASILFTFTIAATWFGL